MEALLLWLNGRFVLRATTAEGIAAKTLILTHRLLRKQLLPAHVGGQLELFAFPRRSGLARFGIFRLCSGVHRHVLLAAFMVGIGLQCSCGTNCHVQRGLFLHRNLLYRGHLLSSYGLDWCDLLPQLRGLFIVARNHIVIPHR